ncbi:SDR family oxidoreductase [Thalassospira lucentensis]|uniref:SDR family oxidoreductase n=1 Tax=Thalassospira lucentensis TaxID=168935 RepID=UPI00142DEB19|nr:SDR family oxidoreductase [Thalassospira lucentensis]NIZ00393.1 SDR family oxidoreductase [Thalassospira lucentensis]
MKKKVYVLGGYGLIGSACIQKLIVAGFDVIGVGRSLQKGMSSNNRINWRITDISKTSVAEWSEILTDADVVVNAAGALQESARDNLEAIHVTLLENITEALNGRDLTFIQISAAGANEQASTEFMRSKARGDKTLMDSQLDWHILRPTLVISRQAYGGTAILRAAAAFPFANIKIFADSQIQTVSIDDVTNAVAKAANGLIPKRTVADLTEENSQSFDELKRHFRDWLGLPAWRINIVVPQCAIALLGKFADLTGLFGWRSPLRTNALQALKDGIKGDAYSWQKTESLACRSLNETLDSMPATIQERWFSKLYLMLPLAICFLSIFWLSSGIIGIYALSDAQQILTNRGMPAELSKLLVLAGSIADIGLGAAILIRRFSRVACLGMITISIGYLLSSLATAPDLWLDPLGPLIKVIPSIVLTLFTLAILDER